jgi:hypothetical protein
MRIPWLVALVAVFGLVQAAQAESYATPNFVAHAPDGATAKKVAMTAEYFRKILAVEWTGSELPKWGQVCPIQVTVGTMGASGSTTFTFEGGEVHSWDMRVRGSLERILDSVIPHEVCHTIFATKFRRPLPRWADEGAATLVEHPSERLRQVDLLARVFGRGQQMPLQTLFEIREYPSSPESLYTLYAEGYSLAEFLVLRTGAEGKRVYLDFLESALADGWDNALQEHYGYDSVRDLELDWGKWVIAGSPNLPRNEAYALNGAKAQPAARDSSVVIRGQTPKAPLPLAMITRPLRTVAKEEIEAPEPGESESPRGIQLRLPMGRSR